ncbi:MAG: hypothetical protein Q4A66_09745, partial [Eubacteriales bacterium]|nr:hypothetical protein [Eubacteriales bacterium]
ARRAGLAGRSSVIRHARFLLFIEILFSMTVGNASRMHTCNIISQRRFLCNHSGRLFQKLTWRTRFYRQKAKGTPI